MHVFHFNNLELCPISKEFRAYLGGCDSEEVIAPPMSDSLSKVLAKALGLNGGSARYIAHNGVLKVLQLIEVFSNLGKSPSMAKLIRHNRDLCMCLLVAYMLVPSKGKLSFAIMSISIQLEAHKDVVPLVLPEPLMGLDAVHIGRIKIFGRSLFLL